ncbi:hypothetical protein Aple_030000 [Acrocarpospora pleiomorpha]|uniref:Uncharacterized protein n=1 Tax=Acrocarpospora pleiomorpha TaxID=90975 RepID=A0A5M3XFP8_9ACTN|nr:hypothetical protein Aple_030000 [Acrocarpospora pleiomorpha]
MSSAGPSIEDCPRDAHPLRAQTRGRLQVVYLRECVSVFRLDLFDRAGKHSLFGRRLSPKRGTLIALSLAQ